MTWHIISDPRVSDFFFAYVKIPKICTNASPELNLESDKMSHLIFLRESDSELFSLPNWQEKPFSAPLQ